MDDPKPAECWLTDMDGVLVHEERAIPGANEFIERLVALERRFLVLTNNSIYTPRDLRARLARSGIDTPEEVIWTSALATAAFLADQRPAGSAYVVGEAGLTTALHEVGYTLTERDPDYVLHRAGALLRRQAEPADDAQRAQPDRCPLRDDGDGRRPDGHRRHQRAGGRPAHHPRADRLDQRRCGERFPYPPTRVVDSIADVIPLVDQFSRR
jgi:hypothetical protein